MTKYIKSGWEHKPQNWEEHDINEININNIKNYDKKNICNKNVCNGNICNDIDAIFVLAGGLDENGDLYEWVKRRLGLAFNLYNKKNTEIICLGGKYI